MSSTGRVQLEIRGGIVSNNPFKDMAKHSRKSSTDKQIARRKSASNALTQNLSLASPAKPKPKPDLTANANQSKPKPDLTASANQSNANQSGPTESGYTSGGTSSPKNAANEAAAITKKFGGVKGKLETTLKAANSCNTSPRVSPATRAKSRTFLGLAANSSPNHTTATNNTAHGKNDASDQKFGGVKAKVETTLKTGNSCSTSPRVSPATRTKSKTFLGLASSSPSLSQRNPSANSAPRTSPTWPKYKSATSSTSLAWLKKSTTSSTSPAWSKSKSVTGAATQNGNNVAPKKSPAWNKSKSVTGAAASHNRLSSSPHGSNSPRLSAGARPHAGSSVSASTARASPSTPSSATGSKPHSSRVKSLEHGLGDKRKLFEQSPAGKKKN